MNLLLQSGQGNYLEKHTGLFDRGKYPPGMFFGFVFYLLLPFVICYGDWTAAPS